MSDIFKKEHYENHENNKNQIIDKELLKMELQAIDD
jgi:hypothetical protein